MPRLTPADLARWRRQLREEGDGELHDPTVAQLAMPRLMAEVERLWRELAMAEEQPGAVAEPSADDDDEWTLH